MVRTPIGRTAADRRDLRRAAAGDMSAVRRAPVRETHVAVQYQTEIPRTVIYRRFDVHVGVCDHCGHTVADRHTVQTSSARGAAASQFGAGFRRPCSF